MGQVGHAFAAVGHQHRGQAAIDPLELGVRGDQARLGGRRTVKFGELHRAEAGHAGHAGGAGGDAFDRLRAEADLFDIDAWGEVLGHGVSLRVEERRGGVQRGWRPPANGSAGRGRGAWGAVFQLKSSWLSGTGWMRPGGGLSSIGPRCR